MIAAFCFLFIYFLAELALGLFFMKGLGPFMAVFELGL